MASSFLLDLANIRLWWETGRQAEGRSQGILPLQPHPLSQWDFLHSSSSLRADPQWFQRLLGGSRSITLLHTKGNKRLIPATANLLLCKWQTRWFSRSSHSVLHARTHRTCSLVLVAETSCTDVSFLGILVISCMEPASALCF